MITDLVTAALKLGGELIEDKDQRNQLAFDTMKTLMESKTYRWLDAIVKLAYASEVLMKGLFRPLGTAALTAVGVYAHWKGVDLGAMHPVLDGSFLAWGASRHVEKTKAAEQQQPSKVEGWS